MKNLKTQIKLSKLFRSFFLVGLMAVTQACGDQDVSSPPASTQNQSDNLGMPDLISAEQTAPGADLESILNLTGKLQVLSADSSTVLREQDLNVHWVFRNPDIEGDTSRKLVILPEEGVRVSGLNAGNYIFRISLFSHNTYNRETNAELIVATISTTATVNAREETRVNYAGAQWNYVFDEDGDGLNNITELMNGSWSTSPRVWSFSPTNPYDAQDPPAERRSVSILAPNQIRTRPPVQRPGPLDSMSRPTTILTSRVIGDARSTQAGVLVTVIHSRTIDGVQTEIARYELYSRLDGSFEYDVPNVRQGDSISVVTRANSNIDAREGGLLSSLNASVESNRQASDTISFGTVDVRNCYIPNSRNAEPGSGYVLIEGIGFAREGYNKVYFPSLAGFETDFPGHVEAPIDSIRIISESSSSTTLRVPIPLGAISGFPIVRSLSNPNEAEQSYGQCNGRNDVAILQSGNTAGSGPPDLYVDYLDVPHVILYGENDSYELSFHAINQGYSNMNAATTYKVYLSTNNLSYINPLEDWEILHFNPDLTTPFSYQRLQEISPLNSASISDESFNTLILSKQGNRYDSFMGRPVYFKINIDPPIYSDTYLGGGVILEGRNEGNNVTTSPHLSMFHYTDLQFKATDGSVLIDENNSTGRPFNFTAPGSFSIISFNPLVHKYSSTDTAAIDRAGIENILTLSNTEANIDLGGLVNNGTFPLRKITRPERGRETTYYESSLENDMLDTRSGEGFNNSQYNIASRFASQIRTANGREDLVELEALNKLNRINELNNKELPVRVHVIYSPNNIYNDNDDVEINGDHSEYCVNRLPQRNEVNLSSQNQSHYAGVSSVASGIHLQIPLNSPHINLGRGNFFIVADTVNTNNDTNVVNYCRLEHDGGVSRRSVRPGAGIPATLRDFNPSDNIIRIPFTAKAPDLEVSRVTLTPSVSGDSNFNLGDTVNVSFTLANRGNVSLAAGTRIQIKIGLNNGSEYFDLVDSTFDYSLAADLAAETGSVTLTRTLTLRPNSTTTFNQIPAGSMSVAVFANSNHATTSGIFEASLSGNAYTNNHATSSAVNIQAPDLQIYGVGNLGDCTSGATAFTRPGTCTAQVQINDVNTLDLYIKNAGTGPVRAMSNFNIQLKSEQRDADGNPCIQAINASGAASDITISNAIAPSQVLRVPVRLKVQNDITCRSASDNAQLQVTIDPVSTTSPQGRVIERKQDAPAATAASEGEGNNNILQRRFFNRTTLPISEATLLSDADASTGFAEVPTSPEIGNNLSLQFNVHYIDLAVDQSSIRVSPYSSAPGFSSLELPRPATGDPRAWETGTTRDLGKIVAGQDYNVTFNVTNSGNTPSVAGLPLALALTSVECSSGAPISGRTDIPVSIIGSPTIDSVPIEDRSYLSVTKQFRLPSGTDVTYTGCYKLKVKVNEAHIPEEATYNSNNQTSSVRFSVLRKDLRFGAVSIASHPNTGNEKVAGFTYTLNVSIENWGDQAVAEPNLALTITGGGLTTARTLPVTEVRTVTPIPGARHNDMDVFIPGQTSHTIPSGMGTTTSPYNLYKFTLPDELIYGPNYTLTLTLTPPSVVEDINNNNTTTISNMTVYALSDLNLSLLLPDSSAYSTKGVDRDLTLQVRHGISGVTLTHIHVRTELVDLMGHSLTTSLGIARTDTHQDAYSTGISSGSFQDVVTSVPIPNSIDFGNYRIKATATVKDENNGAITIGSPVTVESSPDTGFAVHEMPRVREISEVGQAGSLPSKTLSFSGSCNTSEPGAMLNGIWTTSFEDPSDMSCDSPSTMRRADGAFIGSCTERLAGRIQFRLTCTATIGTDTISNHAETAITTID